MAAAFISVRKIPRRQLLRVSTWHLAFSLPGAISEYFLGKLPGSWVYNVSHSVGRGLRALEQGGWGSGRLQL